ncbi:MAG: serine hydrolase domain-containing protein, partial [Pseudomonadota bacterium]
GMTASVVAQLVGEEKVALTAHARDFAPEIQLETSGATEALTLEHLLSHRTGLPPYAYDNLLEAGIPPPDIRHRYAEVSSICPVGTCYSYQNVLFDAVTPLIEQVEERALASSLEARLFSPLNMTRTSLGTDGLKKDDNWARPHRRRKRGPWQVVGVKQAYYNVPAAGGVNSSIRDMARWLRAQMGYEQAVLSQDELALIHAPRVKTLAELRRTRRSMRKLESAHYGLGWRIYRFAGESVVSHFGGVDGGYLAQLSFMPEHDVGIVLLTNSPSKAFMKVLPTFLEEELKL